MLSRGSIHEIEMYNFKATKDEEFKKKANSRNDDDDDDNYFRPVGPPEG